MRLWVQSLASLHGLGIRTCPELWCRSQMWLESRVTVALAWAGGYRSNWIPSLGPSIDSRKGKKSKKKSIILGLLLYLTLLKIFLLKYSWLTILCQFLLYNMLVSCTYVYILFLILFSIMFYSRRVDKVPCAV